MIKRAFFLAVFLLIFSVFLANSVMNSKVYAKNETVSPTPAPVVSPTSTRIYLPGISKSVLIEAEKCKTNCSKIMNNYVVFNKQGEWINTGNVPMGTENGPNYCLSEMFIALATDCEAGEKQIEVRISSPTGPLEGILDLSDKTVSPYQMYKIKLNGSYSDGYGEPVDFYLVYKGNAGEVKVNWIYITRTSNSIAVPLPELEPTIVLGDLDGDDKFTALDFALFRKYLLGMDVDVAIDYWMEVGDVDGDGELTSIDFGLFRKRLLGLIDKFPVETSAAIVPEVNIIANKAKDITSDSAYIGGKIELNKCEETTVNLSHYEFWNWRDTIKTEATATFSPAQKAWGDFYARLTSLNPDTAYDFFLEWEGSYNEETYSRPDGSYATDSFDTKAIDSGLSYTFDATRKSCQIKNLGAEEITYKSVILGAQIDMINDEGTLEIIYWEKDNPEPKKSAGSVCYQNMQDTYIEYGGTYFTTVEGLKPETEYEFQVRCLMDGDKSIVSDIKCFKTVSKTAG